MANLKNTVEKLVDIYEKGVKSEDKKGFADIYKQATEKLFKDIQKEFDKTQWKYKGVKITVEDVNYQDGYFIFGFGTNSVVNFHIKETPGWLYGIWWGPVATEETKNKKKKEYMTDRVCCSFFTQFEEEIDKFKPSNSTYAFDFEFSLKDDGFVDWNFNKMCDNIYYIAKEPYLAFYREMCYADYNTEYVSREKAKRFWDKHWRDKRIEEELQKECARDMFNAVKTIIGKDVENNEAFVFDRGSWISPRYEVVLKNVIMENGKPLVDQEGCYTLCSKDGVYDKEDEKLYKNTYKQCDKKCGNKAAFFTPFPNNCIIYNEQSYNDLLNKCISNNSLIYGIKDGQIFEGEIKYKED